MLKKTGLGQLSRHESSGKRHFFNALLQYFADSSGAPTSISGKKYQIDPRIASFTTIDSPLNDVKRMPTNMGVYLAANTHIKTAASGVAANQQTALTEDATDSWIDANPLPGITNNAAPTYPGWTFGLPLVKHSYTGSHVSTETRVFLERIWR